ncbi:MAG: DUF2953 domain-containing protein [Lachnospiraceae bacterium]|uniref:DUF2953 domain-containing protein n=1 Tax=Mediterraneibacter glycyrrhizinilyticus TaxID=342942 RepID=UPI0006CF2B47|nr:DUF2953 domain-containing protein [Lachnospiraceae bacterium]
MILQIVLWILKIIGWILLAVLGLFVLAVCFVLFTPLRYKGEAGCQGKKETLWARLQFSLLFRFAEGCVEYADGKTTWRLRVAWKQLQGAEAKQVMEETASVAESMAENAQIGVGIPEEKPMEKTEEPGERRSEEQGKSRKSAEKPHENSENREKPRKSPEKSFEKSAKKAEDEKRSFFERIEYTFQVFCDKMNVLIEKKEKIRSFLEDEIHHAAFLKAIQSLKRLVLRLKPTDFSGNVRFGFEDPAVTGKTLAVLSVTAPFFEGNLEVEPEFQEEILEGELLIAGKLTAWKFAALVLELFTDKNIRKTISHIKNFKL